MTYNPPPHYSFGDAEPQPQSAPPSAYGQPQSVPPVQGQPPQSAPPSYSPIPQAEAAYAPPSVPQQTGMMTQPMFQAPPPGPRRSPLVPILVVLTVIGFAGAALSMALWLRANGDLDDAETQLDDRDAQIAELEENLAAAQTEVDDLETQAADAESMRACIDALNWYYSTETGSDDEASAWVQVSTDCAGWLL